MSLRTVLIVALALVCGVSAAVGVTLVVRQGSSRVDTVPVVAVAKDVPRGGMLTLDQVKIFNCPKDLVPPGSITRMEDAVNRVVLHQLVKDEIVLEAKLGAKNAKGGLASLVPPGMRTFTIMTPNVSSGVAGFILPGNKVDVLLTLNGDEKTGGGVTTTLLQDVEILATDTHLDAPNDNKVDPHGLQSVTLLVSPDQTAKLNLGQNRGVLHLSLRNPEDNQDAQTKPATLSGLQFHQEKPLAEQLKDWMEVYSKFKKEQKAATPEKVAVEKPADDSADSQSAPPLEIRTMRGRYFGSVQVEPLEQSAHKR